MKHIPILLLLAFTLVSCISETKTNKSSSKEKLTACQQNPYLPGCPLGGGTTSGTTCTQNPQAYGCPQYCNQTPLPPGCSGTSGGSTGGSNPNPYPYYPSNAMNPNWGVHYPGGEPTGTCSSPTTPQNLIDLGVTAYDTRKGTISIAGNVGGNGVKIYDPASADAPNYLNTSPDLKSVNGSKMFFMTDSILKVRFKPNPQPDRTQTPSSCYGASNTNISTLPGYTKLSFNVRVIGIRPDGVHESAGFKSYSLVGVNSCTPAYDLSGIRANYPNGVYVIVEAARTNQGCSGNTYYVNGFGSCNTHHQLGVRSVDCWTMDIEVAADGTKTFN